MANPETTEFDDLVSKYREELEKIEIEALNLGVKDAKIVFKAQDEHALARSYVKVKIGSRIILQVYPPNLSKNWLTREPGKSDVAMKVRTIGSGYKQIGKYELNMAAVGNGWPTPPITLAQAIAGAKSILSKMPPPPSKEEKVVLKPFNEGFELPYGNVGPGAIARVHSDFIKIIKIEEFGKVEEINKYDPNEFNKDIYFNIDCVGLSEATFNIIVDPDVTGWMGIQRYGKQRITSTTKPKNSVDLEAMNEFDKMIVKKAIEVYFK